MTTADASFEPLVERDRQIQNRKLVRIWLYIVVLVLFALIVVGGVTRLTESGLSITEWKPIHGVIPPLNAAEWQEEFEKYKQIPQFEQINPDMTVDGFKYIFWWEFAHRILARGIGLVFALPLAFFWATGRLERFLKPKLAFILALGALQGAVGWWMVASGLVHRTEVSQYRLATHFTIAALIFAATMIVARGLAPHSAPPAQPQTRRIAGWLVVMVLFQLYLGALVAGLRAGWTYNTWPLMDGALIPGDMLAIKPIWHNFFENPKTVQFMHRMWAYALVISAAMHWWATSRREPDTTHARRAMVLFLLMLVQAAIGVVTLLTQVDFHAAVMHQAVAMIVLGFAAAHWRGTRGSYPLETEVAIRK